MKKLFSFVLLALVATSDVNSALAQPSAGAKASGQFNFYGGAASRSMRNAREYSQAYRQYVRTVPPQQIDRDVAQETADSIGQYIVKSQKHMAWMRKQAAGDKATLASLDSIDKNLAAAAVSHKEMHETCLKQNVNADSSMKCCQVIDESLSAAIQEHDKLMKRLADEKAAAPKT